MEMWDHSLGAMLPVGQLGLDLVGGLRSGAFACIWAKAYLLRFTAFWGKTSPRIG